MTTFHELSLSPRLLKAIDALEYSQATEVQQQTLPHALAGKDLLVSAKTGGGKTAAFLLPMLERLLAEDKPRSSTRGLVLAPTRELALQIHKHFEQLARFTHLKCGLIIGGEAFKYQVADIRKNPEVFVATPGRLVEHIEKGNMDFRDLEFLVLDEADRMLDMGFAEDMHTIASRCAKERQTLLFSATLKHVGINAISENLREPITLEIDKFTDGHSHITQERILTDDDKHKTAVVAELINLESPTRAMVFCKTREQCQSVAHVLKYRKLKAGFIHGELSQSERKQVLNQFKDGKLQVIVATDVAARGLDIADVDLVINFTVAHSGDDHVHRVGRTGRAGNTGKAITLVSAPDWNLMAGIERYLKIRLSPRTITHLKAKFTGPKKLKASGKAASTKKRSTGKNAKSKNVKKSVANKKHSASRNTGGKANTPKRNDNSTSSNGLKSAARRNAMSTSGDGSAPLKRKR